MGFCRVAADGPPTLIPAISPVSERVPKERRQKPLTGGPAVSPPHSTPVHGTRPHQHSIIWGCSKRPPITAYRDVSQVGAEPEGAAPPGQPVETETCFPPVSGAVFWQRAQGLSSRRRNTSRFDRLTFASAPGCSQQGEHNYMGFVPLLPWQYEA